MVKSSTFCGAFQLDNVRGIDVSLGRFRFINRTILRIPNFFSIQRRCFSVNPGDPHDDGTERGIEVEPLPPSRGRPVGKIDGYLDTALSRFMGRARSSQEKYQMVAPKIKSKVAGVAKESADILRSLDRKGDEMSGKIKISKFTDWLISPLLNHPKVPLMIVIMIVLFASLGILNIRGNIRGDMEVYLPLDEEITDVIEEVREDWTIDILMLYVETNNVKDRTDETNISDIKVLKEMSKIEETLNHQRGDKGLNDTVLFVLSLSTLIKELNSTPSRFTNAFLDELLPPEIDNPEYRLLPGEYSIPDSQDTVDSMFTQIPPESMTAMVADTNEDGTYDSAIIIIGMAKDADQADFMKKVEGAIGKTDFCTIIATGPIPMTQVVTERTYEEMTKVLPISIVLIAFSLFLFHRNWKILIIEGVPLISELIITFGVIGALNLDLTPQVVLVAPIIAALGVANGLYITNKYMEESHIKDEKLRMRVTIHGTARPILLAAATTSFGFASLMTINMLPMKVLGFGLAFGIVVDYIVTFLTVPALIRLLGYEKKTKVDKEGWLSRLPVNHSKKILLVVGIVVFSSIVMIWYPGVEANMDYMAMSPQDEPVILKMEDYTEKFGGGQINMFLVRGWPGVDDNYDEKTDQYEAQYSLKDIHLLDKLDYLQVQINGNPNKADDHGIENAISIGITDIMKAIQMPNITEIEQVEELFENAPVLKQLFYTYFNDNYTFWEFLHNTNLDPQRQTQILNVFYSTITYEMRGMLVNDDYSRTLVYVTMPNMDTVDTEKAVNQVDNALRKYPVGDSTSVLTGFGPIVVTVNNLLVESSLISTVMAILVVSTLLVIAFRSFKYSLITVIPVIFVVLLQPITFYYIRYIGAAFNWEFTGVLNLFTAMIGAIIIGLGIDFAIHMTETIREKGTTIQAVKNSVTTTGRSFLETTITMIMGISAVLLVNIVSIREFIFLIAILLFYSMVGGLVILPSLFTYYIRSRTESAERKEAARREEEIS